MSSSAARQTKDRAFTTEATARTIVPAVSSSIPPPSGVPPSYAFSAEAAPFIPSFMCVAPTPASAEWVGGPSTDSLSPSQQAASAPAVVSAVEKDADADEEVDQNIDGGDDNYRQHFSKKWMLCLEQMQGHEVGMLMDMMPLDIQDLYFDKLSDEYLHHDHEHKDKGVHALCAARNMVKELSPEQLVHIEEFLVETDALNPEARRQRRTARMPHHGLGGEGYGDGQGDMSEGEEGENLFVNEDEGMALEEEEWLLEQMMMAAGHGDEVTAMKKGK
ncbi:hypothetical protein ABL78_4850 [Leptomonas seymouri]|uniref:Uncharacterized protein n=1 Tax=Leptomonas seymouri TaxID=5684 RepID=A0A0N0P562_LEPSE|nr:hypothetical protein ABL78_4850 [Leptomonas seymouri]|eukprot:KPI86089.1 hypothetical protein ABL78_4850 [Leptomonas seymouri]